MASTEDTISAASRRLQIDVGVSPVTTWRARNLHYTATASQGAEPGAFRGYGAGISEHEARTRAVMEWVERYAQFRPTLPRIAATAPASALSDAAILPAELGLYAPSQYDAGGFPCVPFSAEDPIEWVEGRDLTTGARRLVPVEFIYPKAPIGRPPLVCETSSGTAAHVSPAAAALAAVCEIVERDAFMIFWHRQPPTLTLSLRATPPSPCTEDLRALQALGFVVTVCCLDNGLGIPCYLALALQGTSLAYGLGCHPSGSVAFEHAVAELLTRAIWVIETDPGDLLHRALSEVRTGPDHYHLYHRGPLHRALRQALAATLLPPGDRQPWEESASAPSDPEASLRDVLGRLAARGYSAIAFDLTPAGVEDTGCRVTRVLVPGLVPIYFGADRIRLGCRRLIGRDAPGRLSTLLPHFMD